MKVKVTKARSSLYWYSEHIGEIFEVTGIIDSDGDYRRTNGWQCINKDDCEVVKEEQWMSKEDALKLAIDGAKVMSAEDGASTIHYMDFNGINFVWHVHDSKDTGIVGAMPTKFKLWTPPTPPNPKFAEGEFVVYEEDYVKIFDSEYIHGSHRYYVTGGTWVKCKEDCAIADESELSKA